MILNANEIPAGSVIRAGFCVVGSGMGGAAISTFLAERGHDVLLLEAGGQARSEPEVAAIKAAHVGRSFHMPLTRCVELGGTSNQWHGICATLDEADFQARPWIPHSGWPIRREDLMDHYRQAADLMGVLLDGESPDEAVDREIQARSRDVDYRPSAARCKLVSFRKSTRRWKSTLLEFGESERLRILLNASALELMANEGSSAIERVLVGTARGQFTVESEAVILCAGGLETPRLLLNSRSRSTQGIGNAHDLVGRYLMDHPVGHFGKLKFHRPLRAPLFATLRVDGEVAVMSGLGLLPEIAEQHRLANHFLWLRPSVSPTRIDDDLLLSFLAARSAGDLDLRQLLAVIGNRDILYRILVQRFGLHPTFRYGDMYYMTEQVPNPDSRVSISADARDAHGYPIATVNWQLTAQDLDGFHRFVRVLLEYGLHSEQYHLARQDAPEVWERTLASAAHHLGTARMAEDPSRGVVDRNLQVFGVDNLFVCDGSVFPTAGGVNPSLTITALALRLGHHLHARFPQAHTGRRQSLEALAPSA